MHALGEATFRQITDLMHRQVGLSFNDSKQPLVASRLAQRVQRLGLGSFEAYSQLIASDPQGPEFQVAVDLLTTNETYFFREPEHFALLERELLAQAPTALAVWSAASSYGDEAYSVAMLLADLQLQGRIGAEWSILGTDISDRVLRSACEAVYPLERLRQVSPQRLRRHCLRGEGESEGLVMIKPELRERVHFGQLNLCREVEGIGPFDVIFLRNVLIYFDPPTKQQVVERVLSRLRVGGLFFMGTAEGRAPGTVPLESLAPGVFRKLPPGGRR